MSFLAERDMAQTALAYRGVDMRPAFPPVASRVVAARQALGVSLEDFASARGISAQRQLQFETDDSAVFRTVALADLPGLAESLGLSVFQLLFGEPPMRPLHWVSYRDVAAAVERHEADPRMAALATALAIDIRSIAEDPSRVGALTVKALFDLCDVLGLDWLGVLAVTSE